MMRNSKNAVRLSHAGNKSVAQVADDLGIGDNVMYKWRQKYTPTVEKSCYATLKEGLKALKLENAQLKMERDMLTKASAYFASLYK